MKQRVILLIGKDLGKLEESWLKYWNKENHDRPAMIITAPKDGAVWENIKAPENIKDRWMDIEYQIKTKRMWMNCVYFGAEAFPVWSPDLGPDLIGAVCGCDIEFGESTSWALHNVTDWKSYKELSFDENNYWWKKIEEMTKAAIDDSNGDYLVGVTDLHPGTDGLVSLRGPEELCMDIFDCPEVINPRIDQMFGVYKEIFNRLSAIIKTKQKGSTNWMSVWHPEKDWYIPSSDFSCLINEEQYSEFVVPGILNELDFLDASIYHLDGPGALHHLDAILGFEKLTGVQWVQGSGSPPAREWLDVYKKIQNSGKNILANCEPEDIEILCENLNPEGVCMCVTASSQSEADDLIALAEKTTKNRKR